MSQADFQKKVLQRNALSTECFFAKGGRLRRKIERSPGRITEYEYEFDAKGHLAHVVKNGLPAEKYVYNPSGQRVEQLRAKAFFSNPADGPLYYDDKGMLERAGETIFHYDGKGALAQRSNRQGAAKYFYNGDTMLDKVVLSSGEEISYRYDKANPICPSARFMNGNLATEFAWLDPLRLSACRDHICGLEYSFSYDSSGLLNRVRIGVFKQPRVRRERYSNIDWAADSADWVDAAVVRNKRERLNELFARCGDTLDFRCGTDQVGTLKLLTDARGDVIKEVEYDSFGVKLYDSMPDIFLPIGFAGGLEDPHTGLVRFGYRDYDPSVGRFTAPDPLGDTGGDHDLYDYCVDDPVSMSDPTGLFPPLALFVLGKLGVAALAAAGTYGAAWVTDKLKGIRSGEESTSARDAAIEVAPRTLEAMKDAAIMGRSPNKLWNTYRLIERKREEGQKE